MSAVGGMVSPPWIKNAFEKISYQKGILGVDLGRVAPLLGRRGSALSSSSSSSGGGEDSHTLRFAISRARCMLKTFSRAEDASRDHEELQTLAELQSFRVQTLLQAHSRNNLAAVSAGRQNFEEITAEGRLAFEELAVEVITDINKRQRLDTC